ncbi:MAG: hypothetical protein AB1847_22865 [bacterium]
MDVPGGPHSLSYYSIDNMDNTESPANRLDAVLDLTAPVIGNVSLLPQTIRPGAPPDVAVVRETAISLNVIDNSGLVDVQIDIAQGTGAAFDSPLEADQRAFCLQPEKHHLGWKGQ